MRYPLITLLLLLCSLSQTLLAQQGPPEYYAAAERHVITYLEGESDASIQTFIMEAMDPAAVEDEAALFEYLNQLRADFKPFIGNFGIEASPDGLIFQFSDGDSQKNLFVRLNPDGITELIEQTPERRVVITRNTIHAVVDSMETIGMAGLLYVRKNGEEIISRPFGYANPELKIDNNEETIFGVGSRPIDFTVAAVLLLHQKGELSLNDPITEYYDHVPEDRRNMTIQHLMTGQSGFPDFIETEEDWNPDLAWIDRGTFEARMLNIPLLFEPGTDRQHSHAAFGLIAAIIERVSGQSYYSFIREYFLDPAGMNRTGEYGEHRNLSLEDFAAGGGPQRIGLPNIPPNWGPTSWLVKGSGGMYSTLEDLQKFYQYVRSGPVFDEDQRDYFMRETASLDGSMRGFELFSYSNPNQDTEIYLFVNNLVDRRGFRRIFLGLERFASR
jgi:CubicO group peptidase (beta-lactamase class C family)